MATKKAKRGTAKRAQPKREKVIDPKAKAFVASEMRRFAKGKMRHGSTGEIVTDPTTAKAIAMAEGRRLQEYEAGHNPGPHYEPPGGPARAWDRLWKQYMGAIRSGDVRAIVRTGERMVKWDRLRGFPTLPNVQKGLQEARAQLKLIESAHKEADALAAELRTLKRRMPRRKSRGPKPPKRRARL